MNRYYLLLLLLSTIIIIYYYYYHYIIMNRYYHLFEDSILRGIFCLILAMEVFVFVFLNLWL